MLFETSWGPFVCNISLPEAGVKLDANGKSCSELKPKGRKRGTTIGHTLNFGGKCALAKRNLGKAYCLKELILTWKRESQCLDQNEDSMFLPQKKICFGQLNFLLVLRFQQFFVIDTILGNIDSFSLEISLSFSKGNRKKDESLKFLVLLMWVPWIKQCNSNLTFHVMSKGRSCWYWISNLLNFCNYFGWKLSGNFLSRRTLLMLFHRITQNFKWKTHLWAM